MRSARRLSLVALGLAAVVACGGGGTSTVETGQKSQPAAPDYPCVPGQSVACTGPAGCPGYQTCGDDGAHYLPCDCTLPPPPTWDAAVDPTIALAARCHAPDGAPLMFASPSDVPPILAGQWWLCGGAAEFHDPTEFTADGHWYKLTLVDGVYQRNLGPDTSGVYTITSAGGVQFDMQATTAAGDGCCGYPLVGKIQTTPPGKMRLGGGDYLRLP